MRLAKAHGEGAGARAGERGGAGPGASGRTPPSESGRLGRQDHDTRDSEGFEDGVLSFGKSGRRAGGP